jgi:hypothetical protein
LKLDSWSILETLSETAGFMAGFESWEKKKDSTTGAARPTQREKEEV